MTTQLAAANQAFVETARWIPLLPACAMAICGLLGCFKSLRKFSAVVAIAAIGASFVLSVLVTIGLGDLSGASGHIVEGFRWIHIGEFRADFSFYIDGLTAVMLLVVTGVGTLITIYAAGYMAGDPGYFRFFSYFGLFIFMMSTLVMADNLVLLYLGWEGVGLASYLLIGFYYRKPSAADAAKKAFIVNRVGDFGFALGLIGVFVVFGAVQYQSILADAGSMIVGDLPGWQQTLLLWIPFLLMLGAFGKSAQLPLHVWLPDAMEGPTPVSALIHAATMVTAGVYMIARLTPLFALSPYALPTVATIGAITAIFAALIALGQYDIKRIWAYSTISQLGYMFLGVGVLGAVGAVYHLFTHAFFKALLFLTAGNVMHALAGQLDLRRMSGLRRRMPITAILMLIGCLALAGFPFTAGFFSKDKILADALVARPWLGVLGIITALVTAFYTFRLWFRVFMGEEHYEVGHEHHGYETDHVPDDHAHGPHEMSWLMNGPLVVLAAGALLLGGFIGADKWMDSMVSHSSVVMGSTAADHAAHGAAGAHAEAGDYAAGEHHGMDHHTAHLIVSWVAGAGAIVMIALAAYFHWINRGATDWVAARLRPIVVVLNNKFYVDELYEVAIRRVLRAVAWVCYLFDRLVVDGLVTAVSWVPRIMGEALRPGQSGQLQGYAVSMMIGLVLITLLVVFAVVL